MPLLVLLRLPLGCVFVGGRQGEGMRILYGVIAIGVVYRDVFEFQGAVCPGTKLQLSHVRTNLDNDFYNMLSIRLAQRISRQAFRFLLGRPPLDQIPASRGCLW